MKRIYLTQAEDKPSKHVFITDEENYLDAERRLADYTAGQASLYIYDREFGASVTGIIPVGHLVCSKIRSDRLDLPMTGRPKKFQLLDVRVVEDAFAIDLRNIHSQRIGEYQNQRDLVIARYKALKRDLDREMDEKLIALANFEPSLAELALEIFFNE